MEFKVKDIVKNEHDAFFIPARRFLREMQAITMIALPKECAAGWNLRQEQVQVGLNSSYMGLLLSFSRSIMYRAAIRENNTRGRSRGAV